MSSKKRGIEPSVLAAGFFYPEILELAKKTVEQIPHNSPMRTKSFVRALGVAKQVFGRKTRSKKNPHRYALSRVLVAFVNFVEAELLRSYRSGTVETPSPEVEQTATAFLERAWERLRDTDDPRAELERLKKKFQDLNGMF